MRRAGGGLATTDHDRPQRQVKKMVNRFWERLWEMKASVEVRLVGVGWGGGVRAGFGG